MSVVDTMISAQDSVQYLAQAAGDVHTHILAQAPDAPIDLNPEDVDTKKEYFTLTITGSWLIALRVVGAIAAVIFGGRILMNALNPKTSGNVIQASGGWKSVVFTLVGVVTVFDPNLFVKLINIAIALVSGFVYGIANIF